MANVWIHRKEAVAAEVMGSDGIGGVRVTKARDGYFVAAAGANYQACVDYIVQRPGEQFTLEVKALPGVDAVKQIVDCVGVDQVKRIHVWPHELANVQRLSKLTWLHQISFTGAVAFNFTGMRRLERIGGVWSRAWQGLESVATLRSLRLSAYYAKDLAELPLRYIRDLTLIQPTISTLQGIETAKDLESLRLAHASRLKDIGSIESLRRLREVEFKNARGVIDLSPLGCVESLQSLTIEGCKMLLSLAFIGRLPNLEYLTVLDTLLADKSLSACTRHATLRHFEANGLRGARPTIQEVKSWLDDRWGRN
ncbi:MAG TPA: hypothetical protein VIM98_20520 [Dyella sp.]|uniref:hypothetical protein n=1 Tax=Dyella sp. TaxID=1869338 RepID=UPI002F945526